MVTTEWMLEAYFDCRHSKRTSASSIVYEMNYEEKLICLRDRINDRTYRPGKSICFVVTRPRYREVFAAAFEDRIVHHYIAIRLNPLFEKIFSPRTFNCRKGKGQLYGINILKQDIIECSNNYTEDCWILGLDLKGFFMSIIKRMLADMIDEFIVENYEGPDKEDLRFLCRVVILHRPEENCERHSPASYWDHLDKSKSLFTNGEGRGIAIGNLFAQIFANFLLNILDWYIEAEGINHHGRYVDDFFCISKDKQKLLALIPKIRNLLAKYGLRLNEKKFYLQHYSKGIEFTGSIVKPGRVYTCNRTITNAISMVRRLNKATTITKVEHCVNSLNSYLGLLRHTNEYHNRRKILSMISPHIFKEYVFVKGHFEVLAIKRKYRKRCVTLKRIRDGDY